MIDSFLFVALPYIALAVCIFGTIFRMRSEKFTQSALSSQFLESNQLLWGSTPWHIGIGIVLLAHLVAFLIPGLWHDALLNRTLLFIVEGTGIAFGALALAGLVVLLIRRITSARIQAVTTVMDIVVLLLLIGQVALGLITAVSYRWGALWSTATAVPYMWSLFALQPKPEYVQGLPVVMKGHILGAYLFLLALPFSRLIHIFAFPFEYLTRAPQKVVWTTERPTESHGVAIQKQEARRDFLLGACSVAAGGTIIGAGVADKLFRFFFGPRLSSHEQAGIMAARVSQMEKTIEQKKYELERQQSDYLFISKLGELNPDKGKYFIDYQMLPALAFRDSNKLPLLLSAKCTHLGCTVGNEVNKEGKILCPCHVSYFDIHSGAPNPDSPAKAPLPHLKWVLMDEQGKVIATQGKKTADLSGDPKLDSYSVFIARYQAKEA